MRLQEPICTGKYGNNKSPLDATAVKYVQYVVFTVEAALVLHEHVQYVPGLFSENRHFGRESASLPIRLTKIFYKK
jgi:hypothetical protein